MWNDKIPLDTDIVITHTPPKYHCDESGHGGAAGCQALREELWRVRPHLAVCGHIHDGRGAEIVYWDLETPNTRYKESIIEYWTDPGLDSKKQSLIDLSSKSPAPLENTGSWGNEESTFVPEDVPTVTSKSGSLPYWKSKQRPTFTLKTPKDDRVISYYEGIRGHGGVPPSGRCDMEALAGRLGRKETCIVNAAIMASRWPYKEKNRRKYNKPIAVDIDLPVRHEEQNPQDVMNWPKKESVSSSRDIRSSLLTGG